MQPAARWTSDSREISFGLVVCPDDDLRVSEKRSACFGQKDFFIYSEKQRRSDFLFQIPHVNADRGLGEMYARGCLSKGTCFGNGCKCT